MVSQRRQSARWSDCGAASRCSTARSTDRELAEAAKAHEVASRLTGVPGIGPIGAMTLVLTLETTQFESGRHLATWLGLVPRGHSSGGKQRLGRISKAGNARIRQLLVLGATTAIRHARPGSRSGSPWLLAMLERQAAQARGDRAGQQDGPRRVGHDGARNSLSSAHGDGLIPPRCRGGRATTQDHGRSDRRAGARRVIQRLPKPPACLAPARGPHLGQRSSAAPTGRTHDRIQTSP